MATDANALVKANGGAVVRRPIKDLLGSDQFKAAVQAALPKHLKVERFIRVALNATMRQPDLLRCSQESFFRAMLDLSSFGLEPDGRRAHLIPFRNNKTNSMDVQLIIDYKGLAELIRRSGDVSYMHADVVYESDEFDYAFGSGAFLKHKPNLEKRGTEAGRRIAFYSFVKLRDGNEDFLVLGPGEVEAVRKRSKAANSGPWVTDYDEMGKKTAFRRHSKWLPLSPEVRDAVEADDDVIDVSGVEAAESIQASVSLEQVKASADPNRGHDAAQPEGEQPAAAGQEQEAPGADYQTLSDEENRELDRKLAEEDAARTTAAAKAPPSTRAFKFGTKPAK